MLTGRDIGEDRSSSGRYSLAFKPQSSSRVPQCFRIRLALFRAGLFGEPKDDLLQRKARTNGARVRTFEREVGF